jgi:hypothetical protein
MQVLPHDHLQQRLVGDALLRRPCLECLEQVVGDLDRRGVLLEQFRRNWEARLAALDSLLDEMKSEEQTRSRR